MAARCQFAHSCELATGNWQPDANSISEDFRQFRVIRIRQMAARCQFAHSCELAPDANLLILANWQLATGSQMPVRFQRMSDSLR